MEEEKKMVLMVETKKIRKCFSCPLCTNLFDHATTIPECLHTFCRKCIEDKLITEKIISCPVCNVDLGVAPLNRLKSDYFLQHMRQKLFPKKPEILKTEPETVAVSLQSLKQKEKSLSSLDLNQEAPMETDVPVVVEKLQMISSSKTMRTFTKRRHRKTPWPKKFITEMVSEQPPQKEEEKQAAPAPIRFYIDLNIEPEIEPPEGSIYEIYRPTEETNVEKDKQVTLYKEEEAPLVIVEPALTPNGRETTTQDHYDGLTTCDGVTMECVFNKEVEEVPLVISSDDDDIFVSSLRSRKRPGRKPKKNGKGKQECVITPPRSRKVSGVKRKYSPPVLRPRREAMTMNSSADKTMMSPPEVVMMTMNSAPAGTSQVMPMDLVASTSKPRTTDSAEAGTSKHRKMDSEEAGTSDVWTMSSGAGTSKHMTMDSGASSSNVRTMSSGAGPSQVTTMYLEAGTSQVTPMNLAASPSKPRAMDSGASTSKRRTRDSGAGTSKRRTMDSSGRGSSKFRTMSSRPVSGFWFHLIASGNQNTKLKPLIKCYLRVTNRNTSISHVKMYIVRKLRLVSEDDVEICLRDEPVPSSVTVPELVRWWVETTPIEERDVPVVGSSGAKFVMPLYYSSKL